MNKAVFLDRDGTVTEEVGYMTDLKNLKLIPGAAQAIRSLKDAGFTVVLITNQSGVARGYFPESLVHDAHRLLEELLGLEGAKLDAIYYCPHHPTAGNTAYTRVCDCRKPGTGLLTQAAADLDLDIKQSFVVGDKWSDIELAQRAGARSVLVMSGFAPNDTGNVRTAAVADPDHTAPDILNASQWIIGTVSLSA